MNISAEQLKSFLERIELIQAEIDERLEDKKSIYAEAKAHGFDSAALRTIVKMRREDKSKREAQDAMVQLYLNALGDFVNLPLGRAAVERELSAKAS